jgi:hypothetical protein
LGGIKAENNALVIEQFKKESIIELLQAINLIVSKRQIERDICAEHFELQHLFHFDLFVSVNLGRGARRETSARIWTNQNCF